MRAFLSALALGLTLVGTTAFGAVEIRDPNGILPQTDQFLGSVPFAEAFRCGDISVVDAKDYGTGKVKREKVRVKNCREDSVTVVKRTSLFKSQKQEITAAQYDDANRNMLRITLDSFTASTSVDGRPTENHLEVLSMEQNTRHLGDREIQTATVTARLMAPFFFGMYEEVFRLELVIGRDVPAVGQILSARFVNESGFPTPGSTGSEVVAVRRK